MGHKENSDELIVVDAERYKKVKKALEASKAGDRSEVSPRLDEKESTRELVVVDVRRYKKVKKALKESEERYRQLFENVPIGIYRTTPDGRIVDSNPALIKMLGFESFADLATRNLEQDYAIVNLPRADFIQRLECDGEIKGLEAVWKRKDGSLIHVRENAKLVRSEEGQVFFEGTVEDITQSKLAEEAQRIHTRQLETIHALISSGNLVNSMPELLNGILDIVTNLIDFEMAQIYLFNPEAGKVTLEAQKGIPETFHLDDRYLSLNEPPFSLVILKGEEIFVDHARQVIPEFAEKWGWCIAGSIPLVSKGRVVGAMHVASCRREVFSAEEKNMLELVGKEAGTLISKLQTEIALRESEKYYRTLIDTSPDIIIVLGLDGTLKTVNQSYLQIGGYSYDEIVGHNVLEFVGGVTPEYFREGMQRFTQEKNILHVEYPVHKKDGSAFPLEMALSLLTDEHGAPSGIMGVGRDISERKRAEEALIVHTQQMEILNRVISKGSVAESLQEMLDIILECVGAPLDYDTVGIFMFDHENKTVKLLARRGTPTQFACNENYMSMANLPFSQVLKRGLPIYLDDAAKNQPDFFENWGWRMACSIPLVSKGRVVGALNAASCKREVFNPEEKNILELIGKEAGTLISKLQTEIALRESEKYYRTLIDMSPDIIVVMDLQGKMLTVNQQFLKAGGYFFDEVIGASTFDFVIGLDRNFLENKTAGFIKKNNVSGSEYQFKKKDGQALPLEVAAAVLYDDQGKPQGIIAIGRDISERKRADDALRESEEKFRSITEQTSDLIAITDARGIITYVSSSARSLFYYEPEEICGRPFSEFLDEQSIPKAEAGFLKALKFDERAKDLELTMKRKDGSIFTGELNGSSFQSRDQFGALVVIRDISQRKRAEQQLRFLGSITENTTDAIIVTDMDYAITYINKVGEQFFGYTLDELKGKTPGVFNAEPTAEKIQKKIYETVSAGKVYLGESLNRRKDGSTFYCEYKVMPLKDSQGEIYAYSSVQRDISQRKHDEEVVRQSEETFRRTFEAIPDPAYIWTRQNDGHIRLSKYNKAALHITKNGIKKFVNIEAEKLFVAYPDIVKKIWITLDKGKRQFFEIEYKFQSTDEKKWLQVDYVKTADNSVLVITKDVSERKEAEAKLMAYQEQLRALTSELTLIEEKERRRIASELHDQIGQNLALCKLKVAALEKDISHENIKGELSAIRRLLECSIQDARSLIFDLSPPVLYELGFQAALEWLAETIEEQYHIPVEFENRYGEKTLESDRQVILFQIVRELLVNVGKHSQAKQAKVILSLEPPLLKIQINDDGVGFDTTRIYNTKSSGFGYFSMRERLQYLGGGLEVRSKPGQGTQIILTVPQGARKMENP